MLLFDEIKKKGKKGGRINVLNSSGDDNKVKRNADDASSTRKWRYESEDWQCNICGLAQKRSRSRSRSRGEDDEQDRPNFGKRWTAVSHHHGVDVVATRKFSRTDPSTMELLASQAIQRTR